MTETIRIAGLEELPEGRVVRGEVPGREGWISVRG